VPSLKELATILRYVTVLNLDTAWKKGTLPERIRYRSAIRNRFQTQTQNTLFSLGMLTYTYERQKAF
jgi:hypothetical protein